MSLYVRLQKCLYIYAFLIWANTVSGALYDSMCGCVLCVQIANDS